MHGRLLTICIAGSTPAFAEECPPCDQGGRDARAACLSCYDQAGVSAFRQAQTEKRGSTAQSEALLVALRAFTQIVMLEPGHVRAHCARAFTLELLKRHREALVEREQCRRDKLGDGPTEDPAQMGAVAPFMVPEHGDGTLDVVLAQGVRRVAVQRAGEPRWYFYESRSDPASAVALTLERAHYELWIEWTNAPVTREAVTVVGGGTVPVTLSDRREHRDAVASEASRVGLGVQASAVIDEDLAQSLAATGAAYLLIGLTDLFSLQAGAVMARHSAGGQMGALMQLIGPLQVEAGGTLMLSLPNDTRGTFAGGYVGPRVDLWADYAYSSLTAQYFFLADEYDPFFLLLSFGIDGRFL